jgi:hypothetical protein
MVVGLGESAMRMGAFDERSRPYGVRLAGFFADDPPLLLPMSIFSKAIPFTRWRKCPNCCSAK